MIDFIHDQGGGKKAKIPRHHIVFCVELRRDFAGCWSYTFKDATGKFLFGAGSFACFDDAWSNLSAKRDEVNRGIIIL